MRTLEYDSPWYYKAPEIHIAVGLFLFFLMVIRLSWRLNSQTPSPVPGQSALAVMLAKLIKWLLYGLVFLTCCTGYFITTAEGKGAYFFDFFSIPSIIKLTPDQSELVAKVHKISAWVIVFLAALHAGAALIHHFIFKDETLTRMLKTKE